MLGAMTAFATAQSISETGGVVTGGVGGKKLDATRPDTGGSSAGLSNGTGNGKKLDVYDMGGTIPVSVKKVDYSLSDTGGTLPVGAGKKKDDFKVADDTGGHGQAIDIGKKKDIAFETRETGGYKLPGDGKKVDVSIDTGGVVPAGGKKHDFTSLDTGDTGGIKLPPDGKKLDCTPDTGGSGATGTIGAGTGGAKKLDVIADSGGSGAVIVGGGKKLDLLADSGGIGMGSAGSGMGKKLDVV